MKRHIKTNDCEMILIISRKTKKEILVRLDANNINEESIYPDEGDIETSQYIEQLKAVNPRKSRQITLNKQKTDKKLAIRLAKNITRL